MRVLLVAGAVLLASCSTTATFYPVEGPLAETRPAPAIEASVGGIAGNSGSIDLSLPGGENCSGRWSSAAGSGVSASFGSLIGQYQSAYGTQTTISSGSGQNQGAAFMQCDDGRTIDIEFITGAGSANGFGFAKDSMGNVYRVLL